MDNLENIIKNIKNITKKSKKVTKYSYIDTYLAYRLIESGVKMRDVAKFYNCSYQTLHSTIKIDLPDFDGRKYNCARKYKNITNEQIAQLYKKLGSSTKVGKILRMTPEGILMRLKKIGINRCSRYRPDITAYDCIALYNEHKSVGVIAIELNTTEQTVYRRLKTILGEGFFDKNRNNLPITQIINKYKNGKSLGDLSNYYNVSKTCIRYWLRKSNIELRKRGSNKQ